MTGIDALRSLGHAVESTSGERQERGDLLALADCVGQALTGRGVTQNEPVHVTIGNRASDLGALLGVWQAGAVVVPVHASAVPPPNRELLRDAALVIFTSGSARSTLEHKCNAHQARGFQLKAHVIRSYF